MPGRDPLDKLRTPDDALRGELQRLGRHFYDRPAEQVAPDLLGCLLVHQADGHTRIGRIVEVEAYLGPGDLAAHTARGRTPRTRAMFGPPGHAYVYLIYGMHHCMNVVTGPEGSGTAVLLRALAPVQDLRGATNGPGRLCRAMGVDMTHYGLDMCGSTLWLARDQAPAPIQVASSPRIGVDYAGPDWANRPLRFYILNHPAVSRPPRSKAQRAHPSK
ncbi:DNA-3-methyladenine glycosylase [Castellaniella sp.]|uniref:DNA-3-methyladenine glycosylase n=1 Tax=Castellaniella sp. TaxID=1955812 RepID=UPI00356273FE